MAGKQFATYQDILDALGETWDRLVFNEDMDPQRAKAYCEVAKTAMMAIEKLQKSQGGSTEKLNEQAMIEAIMRGLSGGMAREILLNKDFKKLERLGGEIIDVGAVPVSESAKEKAEAERLIRQLEGRRNGSKSAKSGTGRASEVSEPSAGRELAKEDIREAEPDEPDFF
jgi:hypothetical protein